MAKVNYRTILRAGMGRLPRSLRHSLNRLMVSLPSETLPELKLKLATTQNELEQAFRILHDAYVEFGYMRPHPSGMRLSVFHALPVTTTLVALWKNEVIGTVSVIRDNPIGLPLDSGFDIFPLRATGSRIAEISALAIHPEFRGHRGAVYFSLMRFLYRYCRDYFGIDHKVIATTPERMEFYESILGFRRFRKENLSGYRYVNGVTAASAYLDVAAQDAFFERTYGSAPQPRNLHRYFVLDPTPECVFPERRFHQISDPVMTPEMLDHFFRRKTDVFESLTPRQALVVQSMYDPGRYGHVLPAAEALGERLVRKSRRFDARFKGVLDLSPGVCVPIEIHQVSAGGLKIRSRVPLQPGARFKLSAYVSQRGSSRLEVQVISDQGGGFHGMRILEGNEVWDELIRHHEKISDPVEFSVA